MNTSTITVIQSGEKYRSTVSNGKHQYIVDEPESLGGTDSGLSPDEWLMGALGSCTAITLRMYVDRKGWEVGEIQVKVGMQRTTEAGATNTHFQRIIQCSNTISAEQSERLLSIANACPLHKTLSGQIYIETQLHVEP